MGSSTTVLADPSPLLFVFISIAFVLFILLLVVLLLYGRSKRRLAMEMKRHSTSQDLVRGDDVVDDDIPTVNSGSCEGIGVDNLAFEKEKKDREIPVIHFPLPPANRPSSESSGTSDSSIYFPKRPYKFNSVQDLLVGNDIDEKSKRKDSSKVKKQARHRRKRKVGSIEHVDVHHFEEDDENVHRDNEFNIKQTISIVDEERKRREPTEAINKNLIIQRATGRVVS